MKYLACCVFLFACGDGNRAAVDAAPPPLTPDAPALDAAVDARADAALAPGACTPTAACDDGQLCTWAPQHACGVDTGAGTCEPVNQHFCPALTFWVCGCDGNTYSNECLSRVHGTDIEYGGPCRAAGQFLPCTTTADCPTDEDTFAQYCVDDPRDDCNPNLGGTNCAGVCVHANQPCSDTQPCLSEGSSATVQSPNTEACVPQLDPDPAGDPAACVYTTRMRCVSATDCGSGELCLPDLACPPESGCLGWCVRP